MFLGYYSKIKKFIVYAKDAGMFDGTNVFITVDFKIDSKWSGEEFMQHHSFSVFDSFLDLSAEKPDESKYANFSKEVRRNMALAPFYYTMKANEIVSFQFSHCYIT